MGDWSLHRRLVLCVATGLHVQDLVLIWRPVLVWRLVLIGVTVTGLGAATGLHARNDGDHMATGRCIRDWSTFIRRETRLSDVKVLWFWLPNSAAFVAVLRSIDLLVTSQAILCYVVGFYRHSPRYFERFRSVSLIDKPIGASYLSHTQEENPTVRLRIQVFAAPVGASQQTLGAAPATSRAEALDTREGRNIFNTRLRAIFFALHT
jgi:hypothetical protein